MCRENGEHGIQSQINAKIQSKCFEKQPVPICGSEDRSLVIVFTEGYIKIKDTISLYVLMDMNI